MWKATIGLEDELKKKPIEFVNDDWDTDPDFINDVTEEEQRWGSKTVKGSGRVDELIDFEKLREDVTKTYTELKVSEFKKSSENPAYGYGGKFGLQNDRMDKCAVGHEYVSRTEKHSSQKDYVSGFGGKFGVQSDRVDKSAVSWDYCEKVEKHCSQKDYATGFGGKFGVEKDRQDKSALGWNHVEKVPKHESQTDYAHGFGGKFGVDKDRQDKSAVGWDHHEHVEKHKSQMDHKVGFGGVFGLQTDRMDKCALPFKNQNESKVAIDEEKSLDKSECAAKPGTIKEKRKLFEQFSQNNAKTFEKKIQTVSNNAEKSETNFVKEIIKNGFKKSDENNSNRNGESFTKVVTVQKRIEEVFEKTMKNDDSNSEIKIDNKTEVVNESPIEVGETTSEITAFDDSNKNNSNNCDSEQLKEIVSDSNSEDGVEIIDTGIRAVALFDYQASEEDEISFDPDDIITHIEMIDEGWWRGVCKDQYGLFPANYVQIVKE